MTKVLVRFSHDVIASKRSQAPRLLFIKTHTRPGPCRIHLQRPIAQHASAVPKMHG